MKQDFSLNQKDAVDLLVIGGGINGAGIARDAAGRGLSVMLCEQDDLAHWTSSRSGKLIHGGLRYLEYYEFRLVREALIEREVLLRSAPHIIWPMRFVLPHSPLDRPAWLIRLGLFLYDHMGGRKQLPATRVLDLATAPEGEALKSEYRKGFEYSDCWVDDARLVVLNALDAAEKGAAILTRTRFVSAVRTGKIWSVELAGSDGKVATVAARSLVNAAGPWVNHVLAEASTREHTKSNVTTAVESKRRVRLVKGSHIVVRKFWQGEHAFLLQNTDKRVIFVNPYEHDKALIGTTDIPQQGEPDSVSIDDDEIDYLLKVVARYFDVQLEPADILSTFSGVRPLYDDDADNPSAVTRDYVIETDGDESQAPLLSVFGGKITTFRKLAEQVLDQLQPWFPHLGSSWTAAASLPGGDIDNADFDHFLIQLESQYPWLEGPVAEHLARLYGTRIHTLLKEVGNMAGLGQQFSETFYEAEARYLIAVEWAGSAEDILYRRTKHHLRMNQVQIDRFEEWFNAQ